MASTYRTLLATLLIVETYAFPSNYDPRGINPTSIDREISLDPRYQPSPLSGPQHQHTAPDPRHDYHHSVPRARSHRVAALYDNDDSPPSPTTTTPPIILYTPTQLPSSSTQNPTASNTTNTIDPCGPPPQSQSNHPVPNPNGSAVNSCNAISAPIAPIAPIAPTASLASPQPFGATCAQDTTGMSITYASCASNAVNICYQMSTMTPPRGRWIWSSSSYVNCTMGFYLPVNGTTSAVVPGYAQCVSGVFSQIASICGRKVGDGKSGGGGGGAGGKGSNLGAVNLRRLPREDGFQGEAVDERYPSYLMVAQTYDGTPSSEALRLLRVNGYGKG